MKTKGTCAWTEVEDDGKLISAVNLAAQASGSFRKLEAVDVLVPFPTFGELGGDHGGGLAVSSMASVHGCRRVR